MWNYLNDKCESLHCSPERVAEYLAGTCSDGDVSALLSLLPTPVLSCLQGNGTEHSPNSPCGTTCERSTASLGADALTLSAGDSPAKTSVLPERVQELPDSNRDYGPKWRGSLAKYDHDTSSWRTRQCSLLGGLEEFLETWPCSGTMRNGMCSRRVTWALTMHEDDCSYYAPTRSSKKIPTPSGTSNHGKNHVSGRIDEWGGGSNPFRGTEIGKLHCPRFEEWLMGWPDQWTALTVLEMDKYRQWCASHGMSFTKECTDRVDSH